MNKSFALIGLTSFTLAFSLVARAVESDTSFSTLNSVCFGDDVNNHALAYCKRTENIFENLSNETVSIQAACGRGGFSDQFCRSEYKIDPVSIYHPRDLKEYDFPVLTVHWLYCQQTKQVLMVAQTNTVKFIVLCKDSSQPEKREMNVKALFQ